MTRTPLPAPVPFHHEAAGVPFDLAPCEPPAGELPGETWLGEPIAWYAVTTGGRELAPRLSRVPDPNGGAPLWRIPLSRRARGPRNGRAFVFSKDLGESLLALRNIDAVELCESPRGVCPDHGATLRIVDALDRRAADAVTGDVTECTFPVCGNRWDYDRVGADCDQVATMLAHEPEPLDAQQAPRSVRACEWHGDQLAGWGWSVRLIPPAAGEAADRPEWRVRAAERELAERCRSYHRRRSGITQAAADLGALGFRVDELPLGTPNPMGPIEMRIYGGRATALAFWRFEAATGVYVFLDGRVPVAGGDREVSTWVELVDALVVEPGARARAAVLYPHLGGDPAERALARARQGAVNGVDDGVTGRLTREIEDLGFSVAVHNEAGPSRERLVDVEGYGYGYTIRLRDDASLGRRIFAGAWHREGPAEPGAPVTWSTWRGFRAGLDGVVQAAAER